MTFLPLDHFKVEHNYTGTSWQDFTGDLAGAQVNLREFSGTHTAALSFYRTNMDPSLSSATTVIKKGDKVRLWAHNASSTWRKMATMRVANVRVDKDLKAAPGRQSRVTVHLKGTGVAGVGGSGQASGVATLPELSNIITGAPFEINGDGHGSGTTTPTGSFTEVASINAASELDQILITRDTLPGTVAFEDPEGTIQVFDSAAYRTGAPSLTLTSAQYSDINQQFDMSHIINTLTIKYLEKVRVDKKHTRIVEHDTTYTDSASIAKYGPFKRTVKVHKRSNFAAYASSVFTRNADPESVPTSVTVPMITAANLLPGYEDGHYVGGKVKVTLPDGTTTYTCRIARIQHTLSPDKWVVQVFLRAQDLMQKPHGHQASTLTSEVGNNPDGAVLNGHLDGGITDDKVAFNAQDIGGVFTWPANTPPASPNLGDVWFDTANGNAIKRWSGTAWVSYVDASIAAAQVTANTAQTTANGKNKVTYSTSSPGATANVAGDLWFRTSGTLITEQWKGTGGTSWTQVTLDNQVIANLDAGKLTTGFLDAARIQVDSLAASQVLIGSHENYVKDSTMDGLGTWVLATGWAMITPTTASPNDNNGTALRFTAQTAYSQVQEAKFPVIPYDAVNGTGDAFVLDFYARRQGTTPAASSIGVLVFFFNSAGTFMSAQGVDIAANTMATAWTKYTNTAVNAPAGAASAYVAIRATAALNAGTFEFDQVRLIKKITGALLVDGAIDGKTITGPTIQTKASGNRVVIRDDSTEGIIEFYSGSSGEIPGSVNPGLGTLAPDVGRPYMSFITSRVPLTNFASPGKMTLMGGNSSGGTPNPYLYLDGTELWIPNAMATVDSLTVNKGVTAGQFVKVGTGTVPITVANTDTTVAINFGVAFPSTGPVPTVVVTPTVSSLTGLSFGVTTISRTGFVVSGRRGVATAMTFNYIAIAQ